MRLEQALTLVPMFALAVALLGLWWQVHRFSLERQSARMAAVRSSLNTLRVRLSHLKTIITTRPFLFAEMDLVAAEGVIEASTHTQAPDRFLDLLNDSKYNYHALMTLSRRVNATEIKRLLQHEVNEITTVLFEHESAMPTTTQIINSCMFVISRACYFMSSPVSFYPIVNWQDLSLNQDYLSESLAQEVQRLELPDQTANPLGAKAVSEQCPEQSAAEHLQTQTRSHQSELQQNNQALIVALTYLFQECRVNNYRELDYPLYRATHELLIHFVTLLLNLDDSQLKSYLDIDRMQYSKIAEHDDPVEQVINNTEHLDEFMRTADSDLSHKVRVAVRELWSRWSTKVLSNQEEFVFKIKGKYRLLDEAQSR